MKKIFLALLAVSSIATANAQTGSILLYGNLSFSSMTFQNKDKQTVWSATPGIGYQFNNHWTAGLNLGFGENGYQTNGVSDKTTVNNYQLGVFARYNHNMGNIFYCYGQVDVDYTGGYTTVGSAPSSAKHNGIMADFVPALGIHLGKGWGMNFSVGGISYVTDKSSDAGANASNNLSITFGQQMNIGISKNFGGKSGAAHKEHHMKKKDKDDDDAPKSKKPAAKKDDDD